MRVSTTAELRALFGAVKNGATYAEAGAPFGRASGTVCQWLTPWRAEIHAARQNVPCPVHPHRLGVGRLQGKGKSCQDCIAERQHAVHERENTKRRIPPKEKARRQAEREAARAARTAAEREARAAARREKLEATRIEREAKKRKAKAEERKRYYLRYPEKKKVRHARRRAAEKGGVVPLTTEERKRLGAVYAKARRLTRETGYQWDVHHKIPLSKGGLHHPDNLEAVPADINNAIGDRVMGGEEFIFS